TGEQVHGGRGLLQVGVVVFPGLRLDARPRQQQAHRVPADRGHQVGVVGTERKDGREVAALPGVDQRVVLYAAQQHLAAHAIDDASAVHRIGFGVQRRQAQRVLGNSRRGGRARRDRRRAAGGGGRRGRRGAGGGGGRRRGGTVMVAATAAS